MVVFCGTLPLKDGNLAYTVNQSTSPSKRLLALCLPCSTSIVRRLDHVSFQAKTDGTGNQCYQQQHTVLRSNPWLLCDCPPADNACPAGCNWLFQLIGPIDLLYLSIEPWVFKTNSNSCKWINQYHVSEGLRPSVSPEVRRFQIIVCDGVEQAVWQQK